MKVEVLKRRIRTLEARRPDVDAERSEISTFLAKLTDEELYRLSDICLRTDEWQREPTEEEACFLAELEARYGT